MGSTQPVELSDIDPATAYGHLYIVASEAAAQLAQNAVNEEQQGNVIYQASTAQGVGALYEADVAATGVAVSPVFP